MIRFSRTFPQPDLDQPMTNSLRGEFTATLGGVGYRFDTTLGTIARIEDACGSRSIMEIVAGVVSGRRAADQMALLAAALRVSGVHEPELVAARADVPEAEAFLLALMGALGFRLTPRSDASRSEVADPLAGSLVGDAGASSRSAA